MWLLAEGCGAKDVIVLILLEQFIDPTSGSYGRVGPLPPSGVARQVQLAEDHLLAYLGAGELLPSSCLSLAPWPLLPALSTETCSTEMGGPYPRDQLPEKAKDGRKHIVEVAVSPHLTHPLILGINWLVVLSVSASDFPF
ncbi:hypothetical protein AMELA_G00047560 [Ameiurus melas]|uniref:Uncharacterized protein n=1 Tax=Ameiurus melas TaxID=219545 RepID=A0A7J6B6Q2_AMEME|nr:hypothetical protein AMELA_G00047560 [Ameiurus melas]